MKRNITFLWLMKKILLSTSKILTLEYKKLKRANCNRVALWNSKIQKLKIRIKNIPLILIIDLIIFLKRRKRIRNKSKEARNSMIWECICSLVQRRINFILNQSGGLKENITLKAYIITPKLMKEMPSWKY